MYFSSSRLLPTRRLSLSRLREYLSPPLQRSQPSFDGAHRVARFHLRLCWAFPAARQSNAKLFGGAIGRSNPTPDPNPSSSAFSFPGDRGAGRALNGGGSKASGARRTLGAANASSFAARAAADSARLFFVEVFFILVFGFVFALDLDLPAIFLARAYRPASAGDARKPPASRCASIVAKRSRIDASAREEETRPYSSSSSAAAAGQSRRERRRETRDEMASAAANVARSRGVRGRRVVKDVSGAIFVVRGSGVFAEKDPFAPPLYPPPRALFSPSSIRAGSARDAAASSAAATTLSRRRAPSPPA